ncbi:SRPBCC family protein [Microbacterium sp. PA5]|uniref:SRPBCC family protein n=1 Tax=Microbacterium sp. PA5 TaxID=3416654 RepID=UPI003CF19BF6
MSRNVRHFRCPPAAVFAVLADGWLYPAWVVGAARMRDVAAAWPQPGARLHHSFGAWPALVNDTTTVEECEPDRRLVLTARGWPMGAARVELTIESRGTGCTVHIRETPVSGPAAWLRDLLEPLLFLRNRETLRRLALLAEHDAGRPLDRDRPQRQELDA